MKFSFLLLLSFSCFISIAQNNCDKEALKTIPGKWLPQPANSITSKLSAEEIAGTKKILNQIQQLFQQQYKPVGMDVYHHHHYMNNEYLDKKSNYSNYSIYTIRNFLFFCSQGKKVTSVEGVGNYVHINPGGIFGKYFRDVPIYDENGKVNNQLDRDGGFYGFEYSDLTNGKLPDFSKGYYIQRTISDYNIWITYEGKQPFRYVSRKEFLKKQVAIGEAKLKDQNIFYSSKEWKDLLEMVPQQKDKLLADAKKNLSVLYEKPLEAYKNDLKKDTAWLNEMAIVQFISVRDPKTKEHQYSRYEFTTVNDPNNNFFVPIMPNPSYYNRNLPKWSPQFITINVRNPESFITKGVYTVVANNIEFFKSLLAKQ